MKRSYDIVIPVGAKDCVIVKKTIIQLRKHIADAGNIYLLTKVENSIFFSKSFREKQGVILINENAVMQGLTFEKVKTACQKHFDSAITNHGWYFQQFIKMAFALNPLCKEYYLIWDADTVPLRQLSFTDDDTLFFTPKTEYHLPYFRTLNKLLGLDKSVSFSFIAEHMFVESSVMRELIEKITHSEVDGDSWFEKIINATEPTEPNAFSEFETYGTYCHKYYPNLYSTKELATQRFAGDSYSRLLTNRSIKKLSNDYDIVGFELYSKPRNRIKRIYNNLEQRMIRCALAMNLYREVVFLQGGLGNQMFQYAFFLSRKAQGKRVKCDRHFLKNGNQHNGFELQRVFGINVGIGKNPRRRIKNMRKLGLTATLINEDEKEFSSNEIYPSTIPFLTLYLGYWQSEDFFINIAHQIRQTFSFDLSRLNAKSQNILKNIRETESVSLHIRLGDYLEGLNVEIFGGICTKEYYQQAIAHILSEHPDACFFVFSNQVDEAKKILNLPNAIYVEGNSGEDSWQDMCLMSQCRHNIIANSSFSWWGAWLNENPDKRVISPSRFLNKPTPFQIVPNNWKL